MRSNKNSTKNLVKGIGYILSFVRLLALIITYAVTGYIIFNYIGNEMAAVYSQNALYAYLASSITNSTALKSLGAYYTTLSLTTPPEYTLIGILLGVFLGLISWSQYEENRREREEFKRRLEEMKNLQDLNSSSIQNYVKQELEKLREENKMQMESLKNSILLLAISQSKNIDSEKLKNLLKSFPQDNNISLLNNPQKDRDKNSS